MRVKGKNDTAELLEKGVLQKHAGMYKLSYNQK